LENKFRQLQGEKDSINAKIALLPGNEIQALTVQKKVDMLSETHLLLLQRQQEFSIARAGLTADFSIVDNAVIPLEIDSPDYIIIPILAVFLGGFVGLVLVLFTKRNIEVIDSPENLGRFGLPVLATVVRPSEQGKLSITRILRNRFPHIRSGKMSVADRTINGLHDLRVCLEYSTKFVECGLILVAAPSPNSGVSFISSRLARLFAECGKTVVVIDANLRDGRLHELMALQAEPGLADVLIDQIELSKALQRIESGVDKNPSRGSISLLSAGRPVNDPVQALMTDEFGRMIESMKQQFDIVIVSAPALLGTTDALPVVKAVEGFKTLVVRAGQQVPAEIEFAISRSAHWGCQFDGLVFCDEPMHFF
jgi:tyrosine-protein kinase Etk/Wzc